MEEAWQAAFRNLYTGFLLRDFAGKIIPGVILLFSISTVFQDIRTVISILTKRLPTSSLIFICGFAWIITLGTQSLAEGLGIWSYFPTENQAKEQRDQSSFFQRLLGPGDDRSFDKDTLQIDEFQSKATEDEKQQYERFVVIKEACGNLFVSFVLSIPAVLCGYLLRNQKLTSYVSLRLPKTQYLPSGKSLFVFCYGALILIGLHRMHAQHVHRQFSFAQNLIQKHANSPSKPEIKSPAGTISK